MSKTKDGRTLTRLEQQFNSLDTDGDGLVHFYEAEEKLITHSDNQQARQQVRRALQAIDTDHDQQFTFPEFRAAVCFDFMGIKLVNEKQYLFPMLSNTDKEVLANRLYTMTDANLEPRRYRRLMLKVADTVTPLDQRDETHEYLTAYNCCPPPIFILLITIVEVIVFVYYTITSEEIPNWFGGCAGCQKKDGTPGIFVFAPPLREQVWRFLSYILLHAGLEHILGNVIMQIVLGIPLELVHKIWRVAPLYLLGAILGAMLQYTVDPNTWLVGASGGVYALIVAHLANVTLNWSEMTWGWARLLVIGGFVCFDVGHALYRRFGLSECENVSYAAHLGGAITGFLLGVVLLKNLNIHSWEKVLRIVCGVLYVLVLILALVAVIVRQPTDRPLLKCD